MPESSNRVLYLASNNRHKQEELNALLADHFAVRAARELSPSIDWDESGTTFLDNARIKAEAVRKLTDCAVLADDSGLIVDALGGAPGVYSSRYGGIEGDASANNAKLRAELTRLANGDLTRTFPAKFVCVLYYISEDGVPHHFAGECHGAITLAPRGAQGFGYDPLFLVQGTDRTMAELVSTEKNALSHRGKAVATFAAFIRKT